MITDLPEDILLIIIHFFQGKNETTRSQNLRKLTEPTEYDLMPVWRNFSRLLNNKPRHNIFLGNHPLSPIKTDILSVSRLSRTCKYFNRFCSSNQKSPCRNLWENFYISLFKPVISSESLHIGPQTFYNCMVSDDLHPGFDNVHVEYDPKIKQCKNILHYVNLKDRDITGVINDTKYENIKKACAKKVYKSIKRKTNSWTYQKEDSLETISLKIKQLEEKRERLTNLKNLASKNWSEIFS